MRLHAVLAGGAFGLALAGCGGEPAPVVGPPVMRPSGPIATARAYVELLAAERYAEAVGWGTAPMAAALPSRKLGATWRDDTKAGGRFIRIGEVHAADSGANRAVWLTCDFEKGSIPITVMVDATSNVSGLWFGRLEATWSVPPYVDPSAFTERDLEVGESPHLAATLTYPKGGSRAPLVILVHGSGPNDRDESNRGTKLFKDLAWGLASRGVAVLRYVKRVRQYPKGPAPASLDDEIGRDARAIVQQAAAFPEIDATKIFVVGHSLGGSVAPRIATGEKGIAGIVLLAAATEPFDRMLAYQTEYLGHVEGASGNQIATLHQRLKAAFEKVRADGPPDETVEILGANLSRAYLRDVLAYDPARTAAALTIPILALQGGRDYQVRAKVDFAALERSLAGKSEDKLRVYPGLNHHFVSGVEPSVPKEYAVPAHADARVVVDIAAWIKTGSLPP